MPTLPTLTVTQNQYDRIVAAFPGTTLGEKAADYNAWLTGNLIDFVRQAEINVIDVETNALKITRMAEVEASLPPRPQFPVGG